MKNYLLLTEDYGFEIVSADGLDILVKEAKKKKTPIIVYELGKKILDDWND